MKLFRPVGIKELENSRQDCPNSQFFIRYLMLSMPAKLRRNGIQRVLRGLLAS